MTCPIVSFGSWPAGVINGKHMFLLPCNVRKLMVLPVQKLPYIMTIT